MHARLVNLQLELGAPLQEHGLVQAERGTRGRAANPRHAEGHAARVVVQPHARRVHTVAWAKLKNVITVSTMQHTTNKKKKKRKPTCQMRARP
jgi:hypothetical protein